MSCGSKGLNRIKASSINASVKASAHSGCFNDSHGSSLRLTTMPPVWFGHCKIIFSPRFKKWLMTWFLVYILRKLGTLRDGSALIPLCSGLLNFISDLRSMCGHSGSSCQTDWHVYVYILFFFILFFLF